MRKLYTFIILCVFVSFSNQQIQAQATPDGFGFYQAQQIQCLQPEERTAIKMQLIQAIETLELPEANPLAIVKFIWPVKAAGNMTDPSFYGISNFVDHNANFSGVNNDNVKDFNCGTRSYDSANGYNHPGTDIFLWPFPWHKVNDSAVEAVAAAAGTILMKMNGGDHHNCGNCPNCPWNAVYLSHEDGSLTWYGHLKNNSLTTKAVGDQVAQGEYLGIVASSGNSTGPHLHFEVYADAGLQQLVDPYAGACNNMNGNTSWWEDQKPYREPTLNKILMGTAPIMEATCPSMATTNEATHFMPGDDYTLTLFFHDQMDQDNVGIKIIKPDGAALSSWNSTLSNEINGSYWFWNRNLPNNAEDGAWKVEVTYHDQVEELTFMVGNVSSDKEIEATAHCQMTNPFGDFLNVRCDNMIPIENVELYDVSGKTLLQKNVLSGQYDFTLNTAHLENGVYFLVMKDKNGRLLESRKLLKATH